MCLFIVPFVSLIRCDKLATCPGCTPHFVQRPLETGASVLSFAKSINLNLSGKLDGFFFQFFFLATLL